jgi:hypothetical protein
MRSLKFCRSAFRTEPFTRFSPIRWAEGLVAGWDLGGEAWDLAPEMGEMAVAVLAVATVR